MEFVVHCLIGISDFILNWHIICFDSYDLIKGHYEGQGSSSAISESSSKCYYEFILHFYQKKPTCAFKQQPILK